EAARCPGHRDRRQRRQVRLAARRGRPGRGDQPPNRGRLGADQGAGPRVDLFFDNVGGAVLDAVLSRLALHARVVLCGAISTYNESSKAPGPANYLQLIQQRATMTGFLSLDDVPRFPEIGEVLRAWEREGRLRYHADLHHGLGSSVDALNAMFTGANTGK